MTARAAPTPVALGVDLWFKRENLAGLCVGGNKSRLLEFALGRLQAEGADTLIAYALDQSNRLRDIAAASRIATGIASLHGVALIAPVQANELLFELPSPAALDDLQQDGFLFQRCGHPRGPLRVPVGQHRSRVLRAGGGHRATGSSRALGRMNTGRNRPSGSESPTRTKEPR